MNNKKIGGKISRNPYVIEIKKVRDNDDLINRGDLLESTKNFSPVSGAELKYNPNLWNDINSIKKSHNCYTYALGKIVNQLKSKAQPGYASGFNHISDNEFNCKSFQKRLKKDSPGSYIEKFDNACIPGFYKVFLALDVGNDYHWWRQDVDQFWSHKPGSSFVTDKDADGEKIKNPLLSNRNFNHRNYYQPCFFACVYSDLTRSIDKIYN